MGLAASVFGWIRGYGGGALLWIDEKPVCNYVSASFERVERTVSILVDTYRVNA